MASTQVTTVPSGTTVVYATSPSAPVTQQTYVMPNKRAHIVLGIIQMLLGCTVVGLSIIGIIVGSPTVLTGSGIYSGIFFFAAGFVGYRAARLDSRQYLIACLVMTIIAAVVSIIASSTAGYERSSLMNHTGITATYQTAKCTIVIGACVGEFFISIVHSGVSCGSCCGCCPATQQPRPAPAATQVVIQQSNTGYQPMTQQHAPPLYHPVAQPGPYPSPQPPTHTPMPMPQPPRQPPYQQPMPQPPYQQPVSMPQLSYQQPMPQPPYQQPMPQPYQQPIPQPYQQAMPHPQSQPPMGQNTFLPEYATPPPYSPEAAPTAPSAPPSAPSMEAGPLPPKA